MDGWPGWRLAAREEVPEAQLQPSYAVRLSPAFYRGVVGGTVGGIAVYFLVVYFLPTMGDALTIF